MCRCGRPSPGTEYTRVLAHRGPADGRHRGSVGAQHGHGYSTSASSDSYKEAWESASQYLVYGRGLVKELHMDPLRQATIRLAHSQPAGSPLRTALLEVLAAVPAKLQSLMKGEWVEVNSEPVVAIRHFRGRWGAIMRTGLVNSYTDEAKFLYQLKNSMQVPSREAERAFRELREKVQGKRADFNPEEISAPVPGALESDPDEPYMRDHFTEQETMELSDKQEAGALEPNEATLRRACIRLAHENETLRPHLLPLLKEAADPEIDRAIKEFVQFAQKTVDAHGEGDPANTTLQIMWGRRYARIVRVQYGDQRSVFGFVDRDTGALLKAESWKRPARHSRGNVLDKSTWAWSHGPHGMAYLR